MAEALPSEDLSVEGEERRRGNLATTQAVLQKACKRRRLSTNGTKAMLSQRLADAGFGDLDNVLRLSKELDEHGPISRTAAEQPCSNHSQTGLQTSSLDYAMCLQTRVIPRHLRLSISALNRGRSLTRPVMIHGP
jgi:hypothetical protein